MLPDANVWLVEVEMRPTSNKEPSMPYKSKKLMSQAVSIQRLALLHRPQLNPELEEEVLSRPTVYQEVHGEFMVNYFDLALYSLQHLH